MEEEKEGEGRERERERETGGHTLDWRDFIAPN